MPLIQLDEKDIAKRGPGISRLLRPLSRIPSGPALERRGGPTGKIIICAHEGSIIKSNFADWRFATTTPGFLANYYEIWSLFDEARRRFCLEKAYLTIYKGDKEYICLHCDPNRTEVEESGKATYQKGPHLHVKCAETPVPKAHFALTGAYLDQTLADAANLTKALKWSIQMIRDEVLDRVGTIS